MTKKTISGTAGSEWLKGHLTQQEITLGFDGVEIHALGGNDGVKASLDGLSPVEAGRFVVHGSHDRARVPPNRIGIEIEAALAFGTGHHGTTRACLLALDSLAKSGRRGHRRRILDVGTGTGVL